MSVEEGFPNSQDAPVGVNTFFLTRRVTPQKWLLTPVTVEWMQALDLYGPVQRVEVLIKRGKGERLRRSVAFARWHGPDLHDFIAVLTGHFRSSSCY